MIEGPDMNGGGLVDGSVVVHGTAGVGVLRAGQVVELDWTEEG